MSRTSRLFLRLTVAALALGAICYGSIWGYVKYEAHRAASMLSEISSVQIGDTEESVLALTGRYGGWKWTPEPLSPREQWIDKEEYDYEAGRQCDYRYELGVSPFGTTVGRVGRVAQALRAAREIVPARLRPLLGLRDWGVVAELSIRNGRVESVSAMTLFEGLSEWLGHEWALADGMPRFGMPARAYAIGAAHLTMANGGGEMISNFITPRASREEIDAAHRFDSRCLTSVEGCHGLCDAAPRPLAYLKQHPEAAWNIIPPQCN
jgi:hypothetical protein